MPIGCVNHVPEHPSTISPVYTTVATAILSACYIDPKNIAALENALRRAGLPEG